MSAYRGHVTRMRSTQYASAYRINHQGPWNTGSSAGARHLYASVLALVGGLATGETR